jgi:hypothetical protein
MGRHARLCIYGRLLLAAQYSATLAYHTRYFDQFDRATSETAQHVTYIIYKFEFSRPGALSASSKQSSSPFSSRMTPSNTAVAN